ncbi:carbohydrate ABC transporter permease [Chloroflexi bacterium TSY]|nr:carbohydrate ABC transporter permease [Chloroflexi bacterium TSY]
MRSLLLHKVLPYLLITALALVFMTPVLWMLSTALKKATQILAWPPIWIPTEPQWSNFPEALTRLPFARFALNSTTIVVLNMVGQLLSVPIIAYVFARLRFPWKNQLFILVVATMIIPYQVKMIPLFALFHRLGMINTYWPLVLPAFTGGPFFIFFMRQYMRTIPRELDDAARIDGAGVWRILFRIILPLCRPPLAVIVVYTFLWEWNDYLQPLIYLNDYTKYTIQIGLAFFKSRAGVEWHLFMAATLVTILPCLIIYFFSQRQLIGGLSTMGLKG